MVLLLQNPEGRGLVRPYQEEMGSAGPQTRGKGSYRTEMQKEVNMLGRNAQAIDIAGQKPRRNVSSWTETQKEGGFLSPKLSHSNLSEGDEVL